MRIVLLGKKAVRSYPVVKLDARTAIQFRVGAGNLTSKVGEPWEVSLSRQSQLLTPLEFNLANMEDAETEYGRWHARHLRNQLMTKKGDR